MLIAQPSGAAATMGPADLGATKLCTITHLPAPASAKATDLLQKRKASRRSDAIAISARLLMHWQSAPGLKSAATSRIEKPAACFRFAPTAELAHTSFHERPEQVPHLREPATRPEHATSVIEVHQESGVRRSALCSCRKVQQSHRETPQEVMANVSHHQVRAGASRQSS